MSDPNIAPVRRDRLIVSRGLVLLVPAAGASPPPPSRERRRRAGARHRQDDHLPAARGRTIGSLAMRGRDRSKVS